MQVSQELVADDVAMNSFYDCDYTSAVLSIKSMHHFILLCSILVGHISGGCYLIRGSAHPCGSSIPYHGCCGSTLNIEVKFFLVGHISAALRIKSIDHSKVHSILGFEMMNN